MGAMRKRTGGKQEKAMMLVTATAVAFLFTAAFLGYVSETVSAGNTDKPAPAQTDFQRLEGRWVRPDGGYILELRNVKKVGSLTAAYYNPRPIKVYRAEWSRKQGRINVFVELRDINYPGSTYTLQYDPATDRLKGKYFQAVERRTFDIYFMRAR
jgi:hypothetical protein